jgi:hypothetical protein
MDRPLNPSQRFAGSNPAVGSLGVAQSGQSAGLGRRRPSVQIRPPRPRRVAQRQGRLLRMQEIGGSSPLTPTISPRSSDGRAAVLHAADRGSTPRRGTARYASGEAPPPFKREGLGWTPARATKSLPSSGSGRWATNLTAEVRFLSGAPARLGKLAKSLGPNPRVSRFESGAAHQRGHSSTAEQPAFNRSIVGSIPRAPPDRSRRRDLLPL